jgi:rhomboid protease GluP
MPKHEQTLTINTDAETALAQAYQAMHELQWDILFAGDNSLQCKTPRNWKTYGQQILVTIEYNQLTITSQMVNGEAMDIGGRNKKNTAEFIRAFESVKNTAAEEVIQHNKQSLAELKERTAKVAEEHAKEAEELNRAMNLSSGNMYVTYAIIAANVLVFILMTVNGAGIFTPNSFVHINWGSNYTLLTLSGDWWRLLTNMFIHFGIIHLLMNMYCLYTVGVYLEPMLGNKRYTAAYLSTGILASLVSLWWHKNGVNSAGASGAVFGVYGVFFALLTSNLIPKAARMALLQNIGFFIVYNLIYGVKSGVDNAAHIGGLLSGFIIGYLYVYDIKQERQERKQLWIVPAVITAAVMICYFYLQQNKVDNSTRNTALKEIKNASYKDSEKFNTSLVEFDKINAEQNEIFSDTTLTDAQRIQKINQIGLPQLEQAKHLIQHTAGYDISPDSHSKATLLLKYIEERKKGMEILKQMIEEKSAEKLMPILNETIIKGNVLFEEAVKL